MTQLPAKPLTLVADRARELRRRVADGRAWLDSMSRPSNVLPESVPFQDPIDEICEEAPPRFFRSTHYVIMGMFALVLAIAAVVNVDIVVVGTGRLTTATPPIMLQPMDRSIVRELNVRPGDTVNKGDVLATLDPTFAAADLASLTAQQRSLLAQLRRLEAELNGQPYDVAGSTDSDELLQMSLYRQRQAQYASQLKVYDQEIDRRRALIRSAEADRSSLAKQLDIAKQVEDMRAAMLEKQSGSRLNWLEAQSARMRIEQAYNDAGNSLVELSHDLEAKEAERQTFIDQWRHQVLEALAAKRTEATMVGEGMAKAARLNDLVVVTAPTDGVVLDVAKRSVGSVLNPAEPLVTIVPAGATMVAEVMINSSDIGYAKPGDEVVVKVDAFPYQRHGLMQGKLLTVSEESFPGGGVAAPGSVLPPPSRAGSGAYHRALVELTDTTLDNLPEGARLIPGMTLTAEIKVGKRTVMTYFLYPITRGLSESIREP
ncbi:MAG: HlyD family type I secretion periplasmic adaptor subunit [Rhodospirillaceae bacterium]|nr:HlyD family type I secretion periplasmic adaptor subunit [Rhodospirillaceae bacterium]